MLRHHFSLIHRSILELEIIIVLNTSKFTYPSPSESIDLIISGQHEVQLGGGDVPILVLIVKLEGVTELSDTVVVRRFGSNLNLVVVTVIRSLGIVE